MIIDRFGDEYETAYPLPQGLFVDDWAATRPPVTARVGGMNGVVDFFGTEAYPLGPLIVKKKMMLVGSSWEDVGTQIDDLMDSTILSEFESKLWGLQNDGTTMVWCYAKCTTLTVEERATNPTTGVPVSIEFFCREGIWYGGSESSQQYATDGTKTVANAGSKPAHLVFTLTNLTGTMTQVLVQHMSTYAYWMYDGTIAPGDVLIVDSSRQVCTLNGSGAYANLTVGQSDWLLLDVGENQIEVTLTPNSGTYQYTLAYTPIA